MSERVSSHRDDEARRVLKELEQLKDVEELEDVDDDHMNAADGFAAIGSMLAKFWEEFSEEHEEEQV